jgi:FlaA1/EpsC-like NDP-sugar epimerase
MRIPSVGELAGIAAGRETNLFEADLESHADEIRSAVEGSSFLVIGGAGSIGKGTLKSLLRLGPSRVSVVDSDENGLAELVRDVRSSGLNLDSLEIHFEPLDALGVVGRQFLDDAKPHDRCLNFAALKHVRSEKDWYSRLRVLEVNVLLPYRLLQACRSRGTPFFFSVSTDKAAAPVNHLGATKRLMEMVMLDMPWDGVQVSSARFPNVAMSAGSLLESIPLRIASGQPVSIPADARRFLVTPAEAGTICAMAATLGPLQSVLIPRDGLLEPRLLLEAGSSVVEAMGLKPVLVSTLEEAREIQARRDGSWPVVVTPLDTPGEKTVEVFTDGTEEFTPCPLGSLSAVRPRSTSPDDVEGFISDLTELFDAEQLSAEDERRVSEHMATLLGGFETLPGVGTLDNRA